MNTIENFINNEFSSQKSNNSEYLDVFSPNNGEKISQVVISDNNVIDNAVTHAQVAFKTWSTLPVKKRIKYLIKLNQLVTDNEEILAETIMIEHGKNRDEALASVRKGNEIIEYAIGMPNLLRGNILEVSNNIYCEDIRIPIGIIGVIVPFNFPFMVPMWTIPIAIATGNCVILKPSEKVPITMNKFAELVKLSGIPNGVFQIVNGAKTTVENLCDHPHINAITFVGSSYVAEIVYKRCINLQKPKKVLALGGAKNYLVAMPDCDINLTAQDVINSYSGCSGQRCMAASVLLIVGEQNELIEKIINISKNLKPGKNSREIGPVIDQNSLDRITMYIDNTINFGSEILVDGRKWSKEHQDGYWIGPTVILHNNLNDPCITDEIFGPVLSIYKVDTKEEAIEIEHNSIYGNAACVYTSSGNHANWFKKRLNSAMIGINIGVPVPAIPFSFGGQNVSKFGNYDITGDGCIEFCTIRRKITSKW